MMNVLISMMSAEATAATRPCSRSELFNEGNRHARS